MTNLDISSKYLGAVKKMDASIKGQCDNCRCIIKEDVGRCPDCNKVLDFGMSGGTPYV